MLAEWEHNKRALAEGGGVKEKSHETEDQKEAVKQEEPITYKTLLDDIENANRTYDQVKPKKQK